MFVDLDIYGVYLPSFFGLMLAAFIVTSMLRHIAGRLGLYTFVWHRSLFDLSTYVLVLGALFSLTYDLNR